MQIRRILRRGAVVMPGVGVDEDRHGWFGEAVSQRSGPVMLTGQAICAA